MNDESEIASDEGALLAQAFQTTPYQPVTVQRSAQSQRSRSSGQLSGNVVHRSTSTKKLFKQAEDLANSGVVTALHLLAAVLESRDRSVILALRNVEIEPADLRAAVTFPVATQTEIRAVSTPASVASEQEEENLLEEFGKDLTEEARAGRISEIIGRRDEILQTVQALARKKNNNPVLVGDPGVGKSAVVEALALRAVQGKDPQVLAGRRIIELNMGSLLAGTSLRGQFEERLTKIIE